jgi:capsular exopolysaccharide synthesis family protein
MNNERVENGGSKLAFPQVEGIQSTFTKTTADREEDLLQIALRHRQTILLVTTLFLITAFVYILKATPIYTSTSRLYVEQKGPRVIGDFEELMTYSKNYLYTQAELLKSTPIVGEVVDDPQIRRFKTFNGIDNLTAYLKRNLVISVGKKDDIISVAFDSPYPQETASIVNAIVESYVKYHSIHKQTTVLKVLDILQKEKVKREKDLSDKYEEMVQFTRENGVVSFDNKGGNVIFQKLMTLSEALTEAQLMTINAQADYEVVKAIADEPAKVKQFVTARQPQVSGGLVNDTETQLESELRNTEAELKNVGYHVTEDHPAVKALHSKIDYIKNRLAEETKNFADTYIEVMRQRWQMAKQKQQNMLAAFQSQQEAARDLGVKAAEYTMLQSELARAERICEILDGRIKELNVTEDTGALNISILEVARPAESPSKPQKAKIMAMALVLGLMFGGGLALVRDWMDIRLRSADEISSVLGIPVLGVVPSMAEEQAIVAYSQELWLNLKSIAVKAYRAIHTTIVSVMRGCDEEPQKDTIIARATAYRMMRSEIFYNGSGHNTASFPVGVTRSNRGKRISKKRIYSIFAKTKPNKAIYYRRSPSSLKLRQTRWLELKSAISQGYLIIRTFLRSVGSKADVTIAGTTSANNYKTSAEKQRIVNRGQKVHLASKSVVAEAYRTIRTAVFFGVPKEEAKTILVTSPNVGDGKTTLASNLAIAMAQAGQKTLILDADFRKPMQHNIFEFENGKGLSSVFAGAISLDEAIQAGPIKDLDILSCGPEVPNPSEILNSDTFAETLKEELYKRYDRIIIDSPPVGLVADSQILAAICDITLLVLRAERSTRRHSQQARDVLLSVGGRLLGAVVNDVPQRHSHYGYYSSYGYGYYGGYGYGEQEKKKSVFSNATPDKAVCA